MNLKIKCTVIDSLNLYKYQVLIYDICDKLVVCDDFCGYEKSYNLKPGFYKIIVNTYGKLDPGISVTLVDAKFDINLQFIFRLLTVNRQPIIFTLTDLNYEGLEIEKGQIILWQNLM